MIVHCKQSWYDNTTRVRSARMSTNESAQLGVYVLACTDCPRRTYRSQFPSVQFCLWLAVHSTSLRVTGCQVVSRPMAPPPVKSTSLPQHPWEHLATDILGPLPSGESLLVTVDYFSRFFEVDNPTRDDICRRYHSSTRALRPLRSATHAPDRQRTAVCIRRVCSLSC